MMMGGGAGPHGDSMGSHHGGCALGKLIGAATQNAGDLGLSEDKIKELDQLKAECQKVKILDEAKVKVACMELGNLMSPGSFDLKAVKAQIKKKMDLLVEMKVKEAELYQQALSLFTPEQLKKLDALVRVAHDPAMKGSMDEMPMKAPMDKGSMEHTCPMP
jgi:Spy/CpxP family protein refolding chaperone